MRDPHYRVCIDSTLAPGSLSYGELAIAGREKSEVLISVHCCHPSLANDNLSGIAVATELARHLLGRNNRLSYRFLFIPATVGSLTWLALHENILPHIEHGLVLSCVGDDGAFHYKQSRRGNAAIDRVVAHVLARQVPRHEIMPFSPYGYDERQFARQATTCRSVASCGRPMATFGSTIRPATIWTSSRRQLWNRVLDVLIDVIGVLERNMTFARVYGRGEPQLGRRGLYRALSGQKDHAVAQMALLWVLNQSDGRHSLLDIAERSGIAFDQLVLAAEAARQADLIRHVDATGQSTTP